MKLIPVELADIPPEIKKIPALPKRTWEAAVVMFWESRRQAVRVSCQGVSAKSMRASIGKAVEETGYPITVLLRDGQIYLVRNV